MIHSVFNELLGLDRIREGERERIGIAVSMCVSLFRYSGGSACSRRGCTAVDDRVNS